MRRSNFVIKLVSLVLFVAIACYIGLYIYNMAANPFQTTLAASITVEESSRVTGYVVREETVLSGGGDAVSITAQEGAKVSVGEEIAIAYASEAALQRASEIYSLEIQIDQLQSFLEADNTVSDSSSASKDVLALAQAIQHKDFSDLDKLLLNIKTDVFSDSDPLTVEEAEGDLAAMESELSVLLSADDSDITSVTAVRSGIFSSAVDGFESVGPDDLDHLTPETYRTLFEAPGAIPGDALGKLITGITWYFTAVMDESDAEKLAGMKTARLVFTKNYSADLSMGIESIGSASEDGTCVVVFSCSSALSDIAAFRELTADVIFSTYSGIRVPKEAVRLDEDGATCIYILSGLRAELVPVDILYEGDDYYIVQSGSESATSLRVGSEIIVKANDLYDGKVVRE